MPTVVANALCPSEGAITDRNHACIASKRHISLQGMIAQKSKAFSQRSELSGKQGVADLLWPKSIHSSAGTEEALESLKMAILSHGLPENSASSRFASTRPLAWKLLLDVTDLPAGEYLELIRLGPSSVNEKIRNDT